MAEDKKEKEKKIPKAKTITELFEQFNEKYGKGTIIAGSKGASEFKEVISTGSIAFNKATNIGGLPVGKLIEIFGPESSGKSTTSLETIAEWQKAGKICVLFDYEHSFDIEYAEIIGIDTEALAFVQPANMEDGYNLIYEMVISGLIDLIIIDSHTSMRSKKRLAGLIGDDKIAPEARVNSDALGKIKPELDKYGCTLIGISQLRAAIGDMVPGDKPTGGNAWKFYPDMRIKIFKELDKPNETNKTTIEIVKNKCGKPFGKCQIPIAWGIGFDKVKEVIQLAKATAIIKVAGSWYSYGEVFKIQGEDAVWQFLNDNLELYNEIREKVLYVEPQTITVETVEEKPNKEESETRAEISSAKSFFKKDNVKEEASYARTETN